MAGSDEEAEGGVEWAPSRAAASRGEDEEMSEPDTDPDIDELAAAGGARDGWFGRTVQAWLGPAGGIHIAWG